jgi:hypothetical protein
MRDPEEKLILDLRSRDQKSNAVWMRLENNEWYLLEEFHAVWLQFLHALLQVEHTPIREGRLQAHKNEGRNHVRL